MLSATKGDMNKVECQKKKTSECQSTMNRAPGAFHPPPSPSLSPRPSHALRLHRVRQCAWRRPRREEQRVAEVGGKAGEELAGEAGLEAGEGAQHHLGAGELLHCLEIVAQADVPARRRRGSETGMASNYRWDSGRIAQEKEEHAGIVPQLYREITSKRATPVATT